MRSNAPPGDEFFATGTVEDALQYARLIWPEFVEHSDMIFLRQTMEEQPDLQDIPGTLARFGGDRSEMERQFNLVEVPTLFASAVEASDTDSRALAEILRDAWQVKLERDFAGRRFSVEILEGEIDDPTVRFFTQR